MEQRVGQKLSLLIFAITLSTASLVRHQEAPVPDWKYIRTF